MQRMNVAYAWPKDDITKAWSGAAYQIMQQLRKDYDVNLVDISWSITTRIARRALRMLGATYLPRRLAIMDMTRKLKAHKVPGPLFCFDPMDFDKAGVSGEDIYLYIDCSCRYLLYLYDTDLDAYKASGFGYSRKALEKLADEEDAAYAKCKKIFVIGRWVKEFFDNNYDENITEKVVWVGGGYNLTRVPQIVAKEKSFLFVGETLYRKSGDVVIEAFKKAGFGDDVKLYIVGAKDIDEKEQASITDEKKNIIFLGMLSREELQIYYEKSKVFIMPSRFEAFGMVFPESILCGCRIITTDRFEMGYFARESGGLITTLNVNDMSNIMKQAIAEDYDGSSAIESIRNTFSWNKVYERMQF